MSTLRPPFPNPMPASFYRGGTSKGIYFRREDLPSSVEDWAPIFLGAMGSPDPEHGRQLNGMGGGVSSLSKVCVVGPPSPERKAQGIDVDYTFAQIGIRDSVVEYGNCGNLSSMIGVFAVDEGICKPTIRKEGNDIRGTVRSYNEYTKGVVTTSFPVSSEGAPILDLEQTTMAGIPGKASKIILEFESPSGALTGKLLPSGKAVDTVTAAGREESPVRISLVDAANPTVFLSSEDLTRFLGLPSTAAINYADSKVLDGLEYLRRAGAVLMGLDPKVQVQPKIAVLSDPISPDVDIQAHALSMGVLHKAIPMTVGLCLGVASLIEGTVAWKIVQRSRAARGSSNDMIRIQHVSGTVDVGAEFDEDGLPKSVQVVRTGRRLMKGIVWW